MQDSSYFLDENNMVELARLIRQDKFITKTVGMFPPEIDGNALQNILDIGCGPGGWLLDVAHEYPHIQGTGIDSSSLMVKMAEHLQKAEGPQRLHFQQMDARQPLQFASDQFDFIQMRLTQSFLWKPMWLSVINECYRLLRRGGTLRIVDLECAFTNKPSADYITSLPQQVYWQAGATFSPNGRGMGLVAGLKGLIPTVGFTQISTHFHAQDISLGQPEHTIAMENWRLLHHGMRTLVAEKSRMSLNELDQLFLQTMTELEEEGSVYIALLFSICSQKP